MNAGNAVAIVCEHVNAAGKTIDSRKRMAIGNYAGQLVDNGATDDELRAWAMHYGTRLGEGARIRPSQAWEDVTGNNVSATAVAGVPVVKERQRERRREGYEWLADRITASQQETLATVQKLTRDGFTTADIVERVLGPRPQEIT